jgi:hypothetical protein
MLGGICNAAHNVHAKITENSDIFNERAGGVTNHYCPVKKLTKPHQPLLFKG